MINALKYSTMYLQYSNIEHISEYCTNIDLPSNIAYKTWQGKGHVETWAAIPRFSIWIRIHVRKTWMLT